MSIFGAKMENDTADLARRLEPFMANAAEYRSAAKMLASLATQTSHQVSDEVLLRVEEISDDIRSDIARLGDLIKSLRGSSATDLALTTEVDDALRLVLLEVTELGTRLYSARSAI
jgi:hypothetical protein